MRNNKEITDSLFLDIITTINKVENYNYDQFRFFPSKDVNGWKKYFEYRLNNILKNPEAETFYMVKNGVPFILGFNVSNWDKEIFGFRIANSSISFLPETEDSREIILDFLLHIKNVLATLTVKFINLRLHGDNMDALHSAEEFGFRYYENIIWPYTECKPKQVEGDLVNLRLMKENELERVLFIAKNFQYKRGHYYCDKRFNPESINDLHVKWLNTYKHQNRPIVVVEIDKNIAGYIVLRGNDVNMQNAFGYKVGQLSSMALDPTYRGVGLGKNLIRGGINALHDEGTELVDTGLATKNLFSSSSIRIADFRNYYEEVTFHLWL